MKRISEIEEYSDVKDFYYVTTCGKILSVKKDKFIILKQNISKDGYMHISLKGKTKNYKKTVHRIVAMAFVKGYSNDKCYVNHIDEIKTHNNFQNLEWCTLEYNANFGNRNNKVKSKLSVKVYMYDLDGNFIKEYNSLQDASIDNGISTSHISKSCQCKLGRVKNYQFRYFFKEKIEKASHQNIQLEVLDLKGNVIARYDSLNQASIGVFGTLHRSRKISKAIKEGAPYKGFVWRKI